MDSFLWRDTLVENVDKMTTLHLKNEAQFLCFTLETEAEGTTQLYAMNVFKIREIIYYSDELTETEGENSGIMLGYLTVREETIPLIDMRRWLYYSQDDPYRDLRPYSIEGEKNLVVICSFSNCVVGLKIQSVKRIIQKNWNEIEAGGEFGIDGNSKVTATMKYDDGSVVQILDVEKMVADTLPNGEADDELELENLSAIHSNRIVLLAEDSKTAAKSLQHIIERLELNYFTFPNGKALLDYLHNAGVSKMVGAVITDLEMPLISGFEVLKRVKEEQSTAHIPVIINSSMDSESNRQMAETLKADAFVTKGNPSQIEQALRRLLKS